MNQDEIKTMMRSFDRLQAKPNKSAQNVIQLNDMWHEMPQIVMHQISVIKEYQEAFDRVKAENEKLEEITRTYTNTTFGELIQKNKQLQTENTKLRKNMKDAGLLTEEEYNKWEGGE